MTEPGIKDKKVAVIGSGFIGSSWAMLFAGAGYNVCLYDVDQMALSVAMEQIKIGLEKLEAEGVLRTSLPIVTQLSRISTTISLAEAVKDSFYIQECVFEDVEIKRDVFTKIDSHMDRANTSTIIGSSSSVILLSEFTDKMKYHQDQAVLAHPVNPPFYCPLVEVLGSKWTRPDIVDRTIDLMTELGQKPIRINKELPGFALNRIQYSILAECFRLVQDDVVSIDDVDKILKDGLGLRFAFMGPFETIHLNAKGVREYCEKYNKGYLRVCEDQGPTPSFSGELLNKVAAHMDAKIPLESIPDRLKWRNENLAALAKLKRDRETN